MRSGRRKTYFSEPIVQVSASWPCVVWPCVTVLELPEDRRRLQSLCQDRAPWELLFFDQHPSGRLVQPQALLVLDGTVASSLSVTDR